MRSLACILAIASTTRREALRQPIVYLSSLCFAALILSAPFVTFFAFGSELPLISEMATASMTLCGLLTAVFAASEHGSAESEARALWLLLARPVGRATVLGGRFLGVLQTVGLNFAALVAVLAAALYLSGEPRFTPAWGALPLVAMELVVLAALATAASSQLPLVSTALVVFGLFSLGHLAPYLSARLAAVAGPVGQAAAALFRLLVPNLECFNPGEALARSLVPPAPTYLAAAAYAASYSLAVLAAAAWLFHHRDVR